MSGSTPQPLSSSKVTRPLLATCTVPGDKSISHRALLLASQAIGHTEITGLLEGEDVLHTADALRAMGVTIEKKGDSWHVDGVGVGGLSAPARPLDMGNSGTAARLMMGLVAPYPFSTTFDGDASLRKRPMNRVVTPLQRMGVTIEAAENNTMPLTVHGTRDTVPIRYVSPVPSAQVKSCVLLAGLNTPGNTTVVESEATRDHTERMLTALGAKISTETSDEGTAITLTGQPTLTAQNIHVPADPSSAAFLAVAALLVPGSELIIENVLMNPTRIGLYTTLIEMGADIAYINPRTSGGEDIADIQIKYSQLSGISVPAERAPSMIDEYPILAVAAACATGETIMNGLAELRVKESDRLSAIAEGLSACGITNRIEGDSLHVSGNNTIQGGATIRTFMDHRIAMSFLILGMRSELPVTIDDSSMIATSFPDFITQMQSLGATFHGG